MACAAVDFQEWMSLKNGDCVAGERMSRKCGTSIWRFLDTNLDAQVKIHPSASQQCLFNILNELCLHLELTFDFYQSVIPQDGSTAENRATDSRTVCTRTAADGCQK